MDDYLITIRVTNLSLAGSEEGNSASPPGYLGVAALAARRAINDALGGSPLSVIHLPEITKTSSQ